MQVETDKIIIAGITRGENGRVSATVSYKKIYFGNVFINEMGCATWSTPEYCPYEVARYVVNKLKEKT